MLFEERQVNGGQLDSGEKRSRPQTLSSGHHHKTLLEI